MNKGRKWLLPTMLALICAGAVGTLGACNQKPNTGGNSGGNNGGGDNGGGNTLNPVAHVHTYGEWEAATAATCTTKAERTRTCTASDCNNDATRTVKEAVGEIDPNAHDYDNGTVTTASTCTTKGVKTFTCKRDGTHTKTEDILIDVNAHDWNSWIASPSDPTKEIRTCKHDDRHIDGARDHDYTGEESDIVPATCTTNGSKKIACKTCDSKKEVILERDENAHVYKWVETRAATEDMNGEETQQCEQDASHKGATRPLLVGTKGLGYTLNSDGTAYEVKKGTANTDGAVVISKFYNGKPVTSIGEEAFKDCSGLTGISIPDSVTSIRYNAFLSCKGLKSVHITDIAKWCSIYFGSSSGGSIAWSAVTNPLDYAHNLYLNSELVTDLAIPDSVTSIGKSAFYGCSSLTSVTIPNSVTIIGDYAFRDCSSLTSIPIPDSVTSIGDRAFGGCSLTSITIPSSVTSIGYGLFADCIGLEEIIVASGNAKYKSDGNCIIEITTNKLVLGCKNSVILNYVTSIGYQAFFCCSGTSFTIPNSATISFTYP